jgi:protein-tyrosine kinase
MSRIHQAMRRAERERHETSNRHAGVTQRTANPPGQEVTPASPPQRLQPNERTSRDPELLRFREKTVTLDGKLIALSSRETHSGNEYLALGDRLHQLRAEAELSTILITSAAKGEGKSLTAANLSLSLCQHAERGILLVDANLRDPSLHRLFGLDQAPGLSDLLRKNLLPREVILRTNIANFCIAAAGTGSDSPQELLNTQRMHEFLAFVRRQFEWVFLDSPALVPDPDADLLSSMVEGVLLVVNTSQTSANLIRQGFDVLRGKNVLGIVRNDAPGAEGRSRETTLSAAEGFWSGIKRLVAHPSGIEARGLDRHEGHD